MQRWISWFAALLFIPTYFCLYLGQISAFLLGGIALFLWALENNRPHVAGLSVVLISVKPQVIWLFWLFLLLWAFRSKPWKMIFSSAIALFALSLLATAFNSSVFLDYHHSMNSDLGPMIRQVPTLGTLLSVTVPNAADWIRYIPSFLGLILAFVFWAKWKSDFRWDRYLPTIMLLSVTSSIFTWPFDWVALLPIVLIILAWYSKAPVRRIWLLIGLVAIYSVAIIQFFKVGNYYFYVWLPPALWLLFWAGGKFMSGKVLPAISEKASPNCGD